MVFTVLLMMLMCVEADNDVYCVVDDVDADNGVYCVVVVVDSVEADNDVYLFRVS